MCDAHSGSAFELAAELQPSDRRSLLTVGAGASVRRFRDGSASLLDDSTGYLTETGRPGPSPPPPFSKCAEFKLFQANLYHRPCSFGAQFSAAIEYRNGSAAGFRFFDSSSRFAVRNLPQQRFIRVHIFKQRRFAQRQRLARSFRPARHCSAQLPEASASGACAHSPKSSACLSSCALAGFTALGPLFVTPTTPRTRSSLKADCGMNIRRVFP